MNLGTMVFNDTLTLTVIEAGLVNGSLALVVGGEVPVSDIPVGEVPWEVYGSDGSLIVVGKGNLTDLASQANIYTTVNLSLNIAVNLSSIG